MRNGGRSQSRLLVFDHTNVVVVVIEMKYSEFASMEASCTGPTWRLGNCPDGSGLPYRGALCTLRANQQTHARAHLRDATHERHPRIYQKEQAKRRASIVLARVDAIPLTLESHAIEVIFRPTIYPDPDRLLMHAML